MSHRSPHGLKILSPVFRMSRKAANADPLPECEPVSVFSVVSSDCDDAREERMRGGGGGGVGGLVEEKSRKGGMRKR